MTPVEVLEPLDEREALSLMRSARKGNGGSSTRAQQTEGFCVSGRSLSMRHVGGGRRTEPGYTSEPESGGWAKTRTRWYGKSAPALSVQAVKSGQRDAMAWLRRASREAQLLLWCGKAALCSSNHHRAFKVG